MVQKESKDFFAEKEQLYGGPVIYKTFSCMFIRREDSVVELQGLLYIAGGFVIFEDFERTGGLESLIRIKKTVHTKYTAQEPLESVLKWKQVGAKASKRFLLGNSEAGELRPASKICLALGRPRIHISFSSGAHWFLEVISVKEFFSVLEDTR